MAQAIVSSAVNSLSGEAKFLSGVTDQVEGIKTERTRMQCFLRDADTRDYKDETVRNHLKEIRSLIYRIEDVVETFEVEVASRRGKWMNKFACFFCEWIFACIFCDCISIHNIGLKIEKIQTDINRLPESVRNFDIKAISKGETSGASNENQRWAGLTHADEVEEYFVGKEKDIKELVSLVVDDQRHHPVISVWGMGGLGKTTVVRKIYKHRHVQHCFDHFAWVCITQQGQIRGILEDILIQLFPAKKEDAKHMGDGELVRELHRVQKENKCLVVLDDMWHMHDWKKLRHAFPVAEGGSQILLTTRIEEVAKIGRLYELKRLNEEESWDLLKNIAFPKKNGVLSVDPNLEDAGIKIVRKCGGLPLAITVLGGILKDKTTVREWQVVKKNIDSYLGKGESSEEGSNGGTVAQVLSLSYNALPYHLKPCFLYLGNLREDEAISVEELYLLWIAEDMVLSQHKRRGETLREVAERYLNELGQRSMVQLKVNPIYGKFESCRLHDMMRDFCLKKGREENFIGVVDLRGVKKASLDSFSPIARVAYRLVIHTSDEVEVPDNDAPVLDDYKQLRSLLFRNDRNLENTFFLPIRMVNYENFESLRVLIFKRFNFEGQKLPRGLGKLIRLRLLSFRNCKFDEHTSSLPSSIFNLPFLQTLNLRAHGEKIKIPNVIGKMKRLRHLYLPFSGIEKGKEKLRLHGLSELEILVGFESSKFEIVDLNELVNLRILQATVADNESLCYFIKYMMSNNGQNLQETRLRLEGNVFFGSGQGSNLLTEILACENLHLSICDVKVSKFPPYEEQFSPSLVSLYLNKTKIDEDPMETLEKLPQLRVLVLDDCSYMGKDLICHEFGFPQLRFLSLCGLTNLCWWRVDKGGMPNLYHLDIKSCPELEMIPDGLKDVKGLQELIIQNMPATFAERIKVVDGREGEDFDKIRHVPSIFFFMTD